MSLYRRTKYAKNIIGLSLFCTATLTISFVNLSHSIEKKTNIRESVISADEIVVKYEDYIYSKHIIAEEKVKGEITIKNNDNVIIYSEVVPFRPTSNGGLPSLSKFKLSDVPISKYLRGKKGKEEWIIVAHGNISGHHETIRVFLNTPYGITSATLHFDDSIPNFKDIDNDGQYEAIVYRRLVFDDIGYGSETYVLVYRLYIDTSSFNFMPAYGGSVKYIYVKHYNEKKKIYINTNKTDAIGPMLASLYSTMDYGFICEELNTITNHGMNSEELLKWNNRLISAGFPVPYNNKCRGGD